ncbi:formin-like protein 14 [Brachypodium distachyon]|uniref:formin-like protein 14 n=1 Tax=Brachypodium distachyon TaxID=15368 RepID=UPI00052FE82A|nr:formin-like protein 14 [Brachypodium distachyon]|eukprot:XP_010240746.1 formin-like protein 14 [Brachypodium distachyon]
MFGSGDAAANGFFPHTRLSEQAVVLYQAGYLTPPDTRLPAGWHLSVGGVGVPPAPPVGSPRWCADVAHPPGKPPTTRRTGRRCSRASGRPSSPSSTPPTPRLDGTTSSGAGLGGACPAARSPPSSTTSTSARPYPMLSPTPPSPQPRSGGLSPRRKKMAVKKRPAARPAHGIIIRDGPPPPPSPGAPTQEEPAPWWAQECGVQTSLAAPGDPEEFQGYQTAMVLSAVEPPRMTEEEALAWSARDWEQILSAGHGGSRGASSSAGFVPVKDEPVCDGSDDNDFSWSFLD